MTTVVVNLRVEAFDVYIGRAGRGYDGYFGNPIRPGALCPECLSVHFNAGGTIPCFERYFLRRVETDEGFRRRLEQLRDQRLGCFCKPRPCHGDIIARYLDSHPEEKP